MLIKAPSYAIAFAFCRDTPAKDGASVFMWDIPFRTQVENVKLNTVLSKRSAWVTMAVVMDLFLAHSEPNTAFRTFLERDRVKALKKRNENANKNNTYAVQKL